MNRMRQGWVVGVCVLFATYFLLVWTRTPGGLSAFDIYMYYYPNMLYFLRTLSQDGHGFFWNPFQNCGQPFFGISSSGVLYPANLSFLFLGADQALRAVTIFNLTVAGVSAYALGRELGVGRTAAVAGALAFELGNATLDLNTWSPMVGGPYVWLPAAMLFCERILRAPSLRRAVALAVVLCLALLPGFPQPVVYAYQLIALRALWEFATRRVSRPMMTLLMLSLGLTLPPLLTAVQLLPGVEMASLSVRSGSLSLDEIRSAGFLSIANFRRVFGQRTDIFNPLVIIPAVIAGASWVKSTTRRHAFFYAAAGLLYFVLAFGANTPLFEWYLKLPLGRLFREPARFLWMPSFCLSVLTALGVDAIMSSPGDVKVRARKYLVVAPVAVAVGLHYLSPKGLVTLEWIGVGAVVGAAALTALTPSARRWSGGLLASAVMTNLLFFYFPLLPPGLNARAMRPVPLRRLLPDGQQLLTHASFLEALGKEMSPQDRVFFFYQHMKFSLMPKTASLVGVSSVQDYEPQAARRYAEYFVLLRTGAVMKSLNQFYYPMGVTIPVGPRRRLLDLAAGRYLVVDAEVDKTDRFKPPPELRSVSKNRDVFVYENTQAFPRAFYVPRVEVVRDPQALLQRLANGSDDLRQVAFVEADLPSGSTGVSENRATGEVEFLTNDPEHVTLRVRAGQRGFLHLADQYFPGWEATVNGVSAPIVRANYLFRLIEVPPGESVVEFRYRPLSVRIGALVSATTIFALAVVGVVSRRRTRAGGTRA